MKKLLFIAAITMLSLQACEKSDGANDKQFVSEKTQQAFVSKYPNASNVTWEAKNNYVIAKFTNNTTPTVPAGQLDAWFDNSGTWYMTETDILFDQLPSAVKTSFSASIYAAWRVDDVDMIERSGMETVYVVEVESGNTEMDLYYSPDGLLVKEVADIDDDYEDFIPGATNAIIDDYLKENHPDARILEVDPEDGYTEVEILDGLVKRDLIFDSNKWLSTSTKLRVSDIPAAVKQTIAASKYAAYLIDDVYYIKTATYECYEIGLESGDHDVIMRIKADGSIL